MAKVIITIKDFDIGVIDQPDYLAIEIRDYNIGEENWSEDDPSCKTDGDGNRYQEIIFSAKNQPVPVPDVEFTVRSYYRHCGEEWDADWDSACDDECPKCGNAISPYKHEDIEQD